MRSAGAIIALSVGMASGVGRRLVEERAVEWATVYNVVTDVVWVTEVLPVGTTSATRSPHSKSSITLGSHRTSSNAPIPTATPNMAPAPPPSSPALGTFEEICVSSHNHLRLQHRAGPLVWNDDLAASAKVLAETCKFGHNVDLGPASGYGQNIAASWGTLSMHNATMEARSVITDTWYLGESETFAQLGLYGVASPIADDFDAWGHFSQEVWVATTSLGCYTAVCAANADAALVSDGYYTVCNYQPPGNYDGEFAQNVLE